MKKTKTKQILSIFLTFSIVLTMFMCLSVISTGATTTSTSTSKCYTYTVSNNQVEIICVDKRISGNVSIPSTIDGYPVTSIGESAFFSCSSLKSINIPNTVTSIGDYAFYSCSALTSVKASGKLTSIGESAFKDCIALTTFVIPNGVKSIESSTFDNCTSLTSITIPNSIESINSEAFLNCTSLTSVTIPNNVNLIESGVFDGCTSLTNINVLSNNKCYSSNDGVLYNKNKTELIRFPQGKDSESPIFTFKIPSGVAYIYDNAFANCTTLDRIEIPYSVTSIGTGVFTGCKELDTVKYKGDKSDWKNINIGLANEVLNDGFRSTRFNNALSIGFLVILIGLLFGLCWFGFSKLKENFEYSNIKYDYEDDFEDEIYYKTDDKCNREENSKPNDEINGESNVEENKDFLCLNSISVYTMPTKTSYHIGDNLDTSGLQLTLIYGDNVARCKVSAGFSTSGFDSNTEGTQTITVNFEDKSTTFDVTVST